jgi:hypothetical protein
MQNVRPRGFEGGACLLGVCACVSCLVLLEHGEAVQLLLLLDLGLDLLDDGPQVGHVLLRLGPLVLGKELLLQAALDGAAQAEDALVRLGRAEALDGAVADDALLVEQVVVPQPELAVPGRANVPLRQRLGDAHERGPLADKVDDGGGHGGRRRGGEACVQAGGQAGECAGCAGGIVVVVAVVVCRRPVEVSCGAVMIS